MMSSINSEGKKVYDEEDLRMLKNKQTKEILADAVSDMERALSKVEMILNQLNEHDLIPDLKEKSS